MKKLICVLLALTLMLTAFAACAKPKDDTASTSAATAEKTADVINSFKIIGDVMNSKEVVFITSGSSEDTYVYAFRIDGVYYRAIAKMPQDVKEKYYALDASQENYEQQANELISPLNIDKCENISKLIIPQAELDKYVGKTLGDLMNEGWGSSGSNYEEMEFMFNKGPFVYAVKVEGKIDNIEKFQENEEENMKPFVIKSLAFFDLGDVTVLD